MPYHWLLKTEPSTYSFDDLERDGRTVWSGVSNALALKHLRSMKRGDLAFIYHTGAERQIVGIAEIVSDPYPDPNASDVKCFVVDVKAKRRLQQPVTLAQIKSRREFADADGGRQAFELVRIGRLSVMPVGTERWELLLAMSQ